MGALKYGTHDARDILERSSARETAARLAAGAFAKLFLREFRVQVVSHTVAIGGIEAETEALSPEEIEKRREGSQLNCADLEVEKNMIAVIDEARENGETLCSASH